MEQGLDFFRSTLELVRIKRGVKWGHVGSKVNKFFYGSHNLDLKLSKLAAKNVSGTRMQQANWSGSVKFQGHLTLCGASVE